MDEGEGKVRVRRQRQETRQEEQKKIVAVQQACKLLHSWELHTEMRGNEAMVAFYPDLLIIFDKARLGYLYYNGYSMHKVSKKREKIK